MYENSQPFSSFYVVLFDIFVVVIGSHGGILEGNRTVNEMDIVQISCSATINVRVAWRVKTVMHPKEYRSIYDVDGMVDAYEGTGRYHVSEGDGFYNLTIVNVTVLETGSYKCSEEAGFGPHSFVELTVVG